jgi:hypothetical protein
MALFDWLKYRFFKDRTKKLNPDNINKESDPMDEEDKFMYSKSESDYDLSSSVLGVKYNGQLVQGIDSIYLFITIDLERKGYNDALANSDTSNLHANLKILYIDLLIVIERALTFYNEKIKEQEFYIESRKNLGMTDVAAEVTAEKSKIEELINKVKVIEDEAKKNEGKSQRMLVSYEIGFKRGLSSITASKLFGRKSDQ